MFTNPIKFYLISRKKTDNIRPDFDKILSSLAALGNINLTKDKNSISSQITLTCEKSDDITINLIRNAIKYTNCRIFNPMVGNFLTNDINLIDLITVKMDPNLDLFFRTISFEPLFQHRGSLVFFARNPADKSIHLVNRHLLEYFLESKNFDSGSKELTAKVADDIGSFIALFDRGLINTSFYETFFEKGIRRINLSGFNIEKLQRSILIIPIVFKLDRVNQAFDEDRSFLQPINLLKKGDSVHKYILNLLDKKMKQTKILATKVGTDINYEENYQGNRKMIPRLIVSVFITAFKNTPQFNCGDELNADMSSSFRRGNRGLKSAEDVID